MISTLTVLLVTFGVLYVVALRIAAGKKLGTVLNIFERAEYYPIKNEVHTENHDMGDRYRRLLVSPLDALGVRLGTRRLLDCAAYGWCFRRS